MQYIWDYSLKFRKLIKNFVHENDNRNDKTIPKMCFNKVIIRYSIIKA